MVFRLSRSLRSSAAVRRDRSGSAAAPRSARRDRSAADAALITRHGQDLLVGLRHQV